MIMEVIRKEKEAGIAPDPDVDTYMKVCLLVFEFLFVQNYRWK